MNHTQSAAGLGGQPQQQQPQFNMASAFFGHFPTTANTNMVHHHHVGFDTSTPIRNINQRTNLSSSSGSASASSSSGLNSSSSPDDGKVEKLSRSHQYKKVSF